ncbi:MAG: hypothetical protein QOH58_347 [Thermoleophilaceae bacterium]|nr:hypothetical protein [Thermoleophilaceae bacterium]
MKQASTKVRRTIVVLVIAAVALGALFLMARFAYEVEDKGKGPGIVPYESGLIYKVRVLDTFTVYAPYEARPDSDKISSIGLAAATTMMLMALVLLNAAGANARLRRFFGFASAGLALLTFDETFALHETVGHNMHFLADVPGVERPDDLIFALYPIAVGVFAWRYRDVLLAHPRAVRLFAVGGFFFLIAVAADLASVHLDEVAEPAAGLCLVAGLVVITANVLRQELLTGPRPNRLAGVEDGEGAEGCDNHAAHIGAGSSAVRAADS